MEDLRIIIKPLSMLFFILNEQQSQESRIIVTSQRIQTQLKENIFLFKEIIIMRSNPSEYTLSLLNISDNEHYVMKTGDYYSLAQISKDDLYDVLCQEAVSPLSQEEKLKKETKYWKFFILIFNGLFCHFSTWIRKAIGSKSKA